MAQAEEVVPAAPAGQWVEGGTQRAGKGGRESRQAGRGLTEGSEVGLIRADHPLPRAQAAGPSAKASPRGAWDTPG